MDAWQLILFAAAVAGASTTLTKTTATQFLRSRGPKWWVELMSCPWCMNHWLAFALVMWDGPGGVKEAVVAMFSLIFVSTIFVGVLMKLFLIHEHEKQMLRRLLKERTKD